MTKNILGWAVRPRPSKRTGSVSWLVDFGIVEGKRVRRSFASKKEALRADYSEFVSRRANLEKIEHEKARLGVLLNEHAGELEKLRGELVRVRCVRAGVERPQPLKEEALLLEIPTASSGVYFLCDDVLDVLYVGMSTDVPARVARHRQRGRIVFSRVFFLPYPPSELFDRESEWIRKLKPPFNGEAPMRNACNQRATL